MYCRKQSVGNGVHSRTHKWASCSYGRQSAMESVHHIVPTALVLPAHRHDDDDVLEYLQPSLLLSRDTRLLIALHGKAVVSDAIVTALLRVGNRITAFLYPPNVAGSTLAKFALCQEPAHNQIAHGKLEMQSATQPSQHTNHYCFPTSIHTLSIDVPFPIL